MKICVIGTGYVGLVAGVGFADMGNDVVCCDIDERKIARLLAGEIPIYEPGLESLVARNIQEKRLAFSTNVPAGVAGAEVIILAVGTPPAADGSANLSYIFQAAETVAQSLTGWAVIATKSTVPVGTGDAIEAIFKKSAKHPFAIASNPEFLKEGDAVNDFMKPSRVIIGTTDPRAIAALESVYAPFTRSRDRILTMDRRSAELAKYAANSMLATRISFMNDMAQLCDRIGADIESVRKGMGSDDRIGPKFLFAGAGFGGSCFPKDLRACISTGKDVGHALEILESVVAVNDRQKRWLGERVLAHFDGDLKGKRIAIWGLAFKPETDDIREAPALVLIEQLLKAGAEITVTDPVAMDAVKRELGDRVRFDTSNYDCAEGADALVLVTEWHQYRRPDFERLKRILRGAVVFDGRNVWNPSEMRALGFTYTGIGRGSR
ncbi:MAG: UDP-glucose/GDP-mannose dehydrogenase family protein [Deltaproteobacteria bacterium]|nr:UDP-glucose/GDP-mannose dehydrogenase family protein [Deltaproteobacteria bacterium]